MLLWECGLIQIPGWARVEQTGLSHLNPALAPHGLAVWVVIFRVWYFTIFVCVISGCFILFIFLGLDVDYRCVYIMIMHI